MTLYELICSRRSIRFYKQIPVDFEILKKLVNAARLAPSAANLQPLEYIIVDDTELKAELFTALNWASYVRPKRNPPEDKRPVAYIVVLINTKKLEGMRVSGHSDAGAACQNILLAALSFGLGACWLTSIDRDKIRKLLDIEEFCEIYGVISLGYPDEAPVVEDMKDDDIKYWLDENDVFHVPKRRLEDVLHRNKYLRANLFTKRFSP